MKRCKGENVRNEKNIEHRKKEEILIMRRLQTQEKSYNKDGVQRDYFFFINQVYNLNKIVNTWKPQSKGVLFNRTVKTYCFNCKLLRMLNFWI